MRKEPTVSVGPGLFRIYSMCVKRRVPLFRDNDALTQTPTHPPIPQTPHFTTENSKPFSCPGRKMSVVWDIASNVSGSVGRA